MPSLYIVEEWKPMMTIRTDLAAESHAFWMETAAETTQLQGVRAREETVRGCSVTRVEVLNEEGAKSLGKPRGTYLTLDYSPLKAGDSERFSQFAKALAQLISSLLPPEGTVLVAGLGNRHMTPDALGTLTLDSLLVTRHLGKILPDLRSVAAIGAGVLGTTGIEAAEWIKGAVQRIQPSAVLLVDALAARSLDRLCTTVQISDSGLVPGSGIGNRRCALNKETLGVPVIAVGVPTVVDAATLARDTVAGCGGDTAKIKFPAGSRHPFVTPDSIDVQVRGAARLLACGLNLALQEGMELEDIRALTDP